MPDYAKMYKRVFNAATDAIRILQQAQIDTEQLYIESEPPDIRVLPSVDATNGDDNGGDNDTSE